MGGRSGAAHGDARALPRRADACWGTRGRRGSATAGRERTSRRVGAWKGPPGNRPGKKQASRQPGRPRSKMAISLNKQELASTRVGLCSAAKPSFMGDYTFDTGTKMAKIGADRPASIRDLAYHCRLD